MDLNETLYPIFGIIIMVFLVLRFVNRKRHKEIVERGNSISGTVEELHQSRGQLYSIRGTCTPIVSFSWEGVSYRLKTLVPVDYERYTVGSEVELLFLPEYPKIVAIKGEGPAPVWKFALFAALQAAIAAWLILDSDLNRITSLF